MKSLAARIGAALALHQRSIPGRASASQPDSLVEAVRAAAQAINASALKPVAPLNAPIACQPATLLMLLTYCYACQTYSSSDIEALVRADAGFRELCQDQLPDSRLIRRFRRENRDALQFCLESALQFVAEQKLASGLVTRINGPNLAEEARRRLIMAMFVDSMECNKDTASEAPVELRYLMAKTGAPRY